MLGWITIVGFWISLSYIKSEIYFKETFDDEGWKDRWTISSWRPEAELGEWQHTPGEWYIDAEDKGIKTSNDAKFYAISAPFQKEFTNLNKDLIIQFSIKHEQGLDCGGGYLKIMSKDVDATKFGGETPYAIMFGPDKCGMNKQTHAILNFARPKGDKEPHNMDHRTSIDSVDDKNAHLYTFRIFKNDTYDVKIDGEVKQSGLLSDDWPFQPEKEIPDPKSSKPQDWVDEEQIPDPNDKKPEGYDDIPSHIPDPEAEKPEDWDDEDDGEWEPPLIDNPDYEGEWKPKMIANPDYKGPWVHPRIPNPDYFESKTLHARCNQCYRVGIDIWQVKSGSLFDDMLITDSMEEATAHEKEVMKKITKLKEKHDEIEKEEAKKLEEARKKAEAEAKQPTSGEDEESEDHEESEEEPESGDVKEEL